MPEVGPAWDCREQGRCGMDTTSGALPECTWLAALPAEPVMASLPFRIGAAVSQLVSRSGSRIAKTRGVAPDGSSHEEYARWLEARRSPPRSVPAIPQGIQRHRSGFSEGEAVAGLILIVIVVAVGVAFLGWAQPFKRMLASVHPTAPVAAAPEPTPYVLWAEWIGGLQKTQDGGMTNPLRWQPVSSHRTLEECRPHENTKPNPGWGRFVCLPATVNPNMHGK